MASPSPPALSPSEHPPAIQQGERDLPTADHHDAKLERGVAEVLKEAGTTGAQSVPIPAEAGTDQSASKDDEGTALNSTRSGSTTETKVTIPVEQDSDAVPTESQPIESGLPTSDAAKKSTVNAPTPITGINSTASIPSSSFVRVGSPAGGISGSSILGSAPKKFSTVNINKKFLGKVAVANTAPVAPSPSLLSTKPNSGLGSITRPSLSPNASANSTPRLTITKLTSGVNPKPSIPAGALASAPAAGWAKIPSSKSPGPNDSAPSNEGSRPVSMGLESLKRGPLNGVMAGMNIGLGVRTKREWAQVPSSQQAFRIGLGRDFPTAGEVIEGQRQAQSQAQSLAQMRAAHNAALIEGLDSFRGVNRDPKMHYWDEDDDGTDDVIDFGDGTTYTVPVVNNAGPSVEAFDEGPVSKDERFAAENFDRSWPGRGMHNVDESHPSHPSRTLFNDRSNKFELMERQTAEKPQAQIASRPQQILARQIGGPQSMGQSGRERHLEDASRQAPPHMREQSRPMPPHLAEQNFDRAPPPHLRDTQRPGQHGLEPRRDNFDPIHYGRDQANRRRSSGIAGFNPEDRAALSYLNRSHESQGVSRPDKWAARDREPEPEHRDHHPDSGRPRVHPHSNVPSNTREANGSTVKANTERSPELARPTIDQVHVEAKKEPVANVIEMQKDEMHTAAERARLRRQQEETEREAQAERARRKAKEIEERMALANPMKEKALSPVAAKVLLSRQAPEPLIPSLPPPASSSVSKPPSEDKSKVITSSDVLATRSTGVPERRRSTDRRPSQSATSLQAVQPPKAAPVSAFGMAIERPVAHLPTKPTAISPASSKMPSLPLSLDALDQPIPDSVESMEYTSMQSLGDESDRRPDHLRFGRRTIDPGPGTWRRSGDALTKVEEGVSGSGRSEDIIHTGLPTQQELFKAAADAVHTPTSPPAATSGPVLDIFKGDKPSRTAEPESNFDQIMARIASAIVAENSAAHARTSSVSKDLGTVEASSGGEKTLTSPDIPLTPRKGSIVTRIPSSSNEATNPRRPAPVLYMTLAQPYDFTFTAAAVPSDPTPAWKSYTVRLPKEDSRKTTRGSQYSRDSVPLPRGWLLSWDPPFEQLNKVSLSRSDWLIPATYARGRPVAQVNLPKVKAVVDPITSPSDPTRKEGDASVELSFSHVDSQPEPPQTINTDESYLLLDQNNEKVIVRLPTQTRRLGSSSTRTLEATPLISEPEDAQTSVEIDWSASSPVAPVIKLSDLVPTQRPSSTLAQRQISTRKLPEGAAVVFAHPTASSFNEDLDARSSVRFMVSSELEGDNLLEEVNNMSMDGLLDSSVDLHSVNEKQADTIAQRNHMIARSGPPSPNAAASAAWAKSVRYPVTQSPHRGISNRDHIKNVWSQPGSDNAPKSSNSLMGIADDLPPKLPISLQDLRDETDRTDHRQGNLDVDSPRFASIGAVRSEISQNYTGSTDNADQHAYLPNGLTYSNDTPSPLLSHHQPRGATGYGSQGLANPLPNISAGLPGQHRGQHGVWVPLNQAGMNSNTTMSSAMGAYMGGLPGSPVYGSGTSLHRGSNRSASSNPPYNTSQSNTGMYSHSTGPIDSPSFSYMRPSFPMGNNYQNSASQSYSNSGQPSREGYNRGGYGLSSNMRNGGEGNSQGHSRYASMGSLRGNGYGQAQTDNNNRNGGRDTGTFEGNAKINTLGNGAVKRPW